MANVAYHTHQFEIPTASEADGAAGIDDSKAMTALSTAAAIAAQAATVGDGQLARSALQPDDIGISVASAAQGAKADKFSTNVSATNRFGMDGDGGLFIHEQPSSVPTFKVGISLRTQSDLSYTGGTPGNVASGHYNSVSVDANVADYVWAGLDVLVNNATAGENVARYSQATKSSTGPTWAGVFELQETVDIATNGGGAVVTEIDLFGNGSNNAANRVAIDVVLGKNNPAGAAYSAGYGLRFTPKSGEATLQNAIYLNGAVTYGLRFESSGTIGVWFGQSANYAVGINLSDATFSAAAIRLAADQKIQLIANGSVGFGYETTGTKIAMRVSGSEKVSFDMGVAAMRINGTIVVGARVTGWAGMTGTRDKSTVYDTSTITLQQLAQRVAALQSDCLATHGLIGA